MSIALIWLLAALILAGLEMLTGDFLLLMLGAGALVTAGGALLFDQLWVQGLIFAAASGALIFLVRPALRRRFNRGGIATNVDALLGKPALVLEEVNHLGGRVRIGGEEWSARLASAGASAPVGATLTVEKIEGATAIVGRPEEA